MKQQWEVVLWHIGLIDNLVFPEGLWNYTLRNTVFPFALLGPYWHKGMSHWLLIMQAQKREIRSTIFYASSSSSILRTNIIMYCSVLGFYVLCK